MFRTSFTAIALLACSVVSSAQAPVVDPALGSWIGEGGTPQDRVPIGLRLISNAEGITEARAYLPVLNIYDVQLGIAREGEVYKIPELGIEMSLKQGKLTGTFGSRKLPITFTRTETLPSDPPVPTLTNGPTPTWRTKLGGTIYSGVAVRDGVAYVGTTGGVFNAVNVKDGSFEWTFSAGRPMHGEALVTTDAVFFVCDNGFLFKLNRADGKESWRYDLGDALVPRVLQHQAVFEWDYLSPRPTLDGGVIYVGSGDGSLHAVNAGSGKRVWRFASQGKIRSDALIVADRVYVGSFDGGLYAISRSTGAQIWRHDTKAPVTSSPALIDGKIIVGNRGSGLVALNPADGEPVWRAPFWGSWVESTAVPYGNQFYIGASDSRRVTAYDPEDGRVVWRTDVFGWNWGRPLVTEKHIFVGVAGGSPYMIRHVPSLTALDRSTGRIVWRWVPPESEALQSGFPAGPVIDGKTLVIAAMDGTLYGFPLM